ncbi:sensor histidine kinase [Rathayibacter soli]|uniref:sensor histidine kinase n=1 Tax=Rathayibacter soli TaxID=3144168 RepID=UPI0027E513A1|nr:sensor histidine kinase [Glaciibacter superstes]
MSGESPAVVSRARTTIFGTTAFLVDAAIATLIAAAALVGVWGELTYAPHPISTATIAFPAGAYLIALAASTLLLERRRHPIAVSAVILALILGYHLLGYPGGAPALPLFVSAYSIAAYGRSLRWALIAVAFVVAWQLMQSLPPNAQAWNSIATVATAGGMLAYVLIGASAGQLRRAHVLNLQAAAESAETRMRQTLSEERLDIARELHDVLAHTISAISVQSGLALDAFEDNPAQARAAISTVRTLARQAIPELRSTLELLRSDGDAAGSAETTGRLSSKPRLAETRQLFREARSTGLTVTTSIDVPPGVLTPVEELTAYRIVQEALTNVIRHADASSVQVSAIVREGALTVSVADDGRGTGGAPVPGLGLRGMRERVQSLDGSFSAEDRPEGGFQISAVLPIGAGSSVIAPKAAS